MFSVKVRFAGLTALRSSLGIFLTALLTVPFASFMHRMFDGSWYVDWRLMLSVSGILTLCFFSFSFVTQLLEFQTSESRERRGRLVFPGLVWIRGVYLGGIVLGITLMVGTYREGDPPWDTALPFLFVLLGVLPWPRAIEITDSEVRQRWWFFVYRRIQFADIQSIVNDPSRDEAVVFSKTGKAIVHSAQHADRERFLEELENLSHRPEYEIGKLA
jgi:hypothetical protein